MSGKFVKILNIEEAEKLHIKELELADGNKLLMINIAVIPKGFSIQSFLDFLEETNVILVDNK